MVEWRLKCDVAMCEAELVAQGSHDDHAIARLRQRVREEGWELDGEIHRCKHHRRLPA